MLHKIIAIARWEFSEKVRNKTFLFSIIFTPIIIYGMTLLPGSFAKREQTSPVALGIYIKDSDTAKKIAGQLDRFTLFNGQPKFVSVIIPPQKGENKAKEYVITKKIEGYITREENFSGNWKFVTLFPSVPLWLNELRLALRDVTLQEKLSPPAAAEFSGAVSSIDFLFSTKALFNTDNEDSALAKKITSGYILVLVLLMSILIGGGMFVRNMMLEKSNRIAEILISSCSAKTILAGKVAGISIFGFFQLFVWTVTGVAILSLSASESSLFFNLSPLHFLYFFLGYVFYTSIFVGLGSLVVTDYQAQQLTGYLSMALLIPIVLSGQVLLDPDSALSSIMTYIPFTTAPSMILKLVTGHVSPIQIIVTSLILLISISVTIYYSAILFETGIIHFERKPSFLKAIKRNKK